jgi:hypothetical protein
MKKLLGTNMFIVLCFAGRVGGRGKKLKECVFDFGRSIHRFFSLFTARNTSLVALAKNKDAALAVALT